MSVFKVTTRSGSEYLIDPETGHWFNRDSGQHKLAALQSALVAHPGFPWHTPEDWVDIDLPVIGRKMYVADYKGDWRISTPVVSVERVEAEQEVN